MWGGQYIRAVETSQTLLLNEQSRNREVSGQTVYKFGFGQSPFPALPAATDMLREFAHRKDYTSVQGLLPLREKVAEFHRAMDGIDVTADRVLVAPGSKILLYAVLSALTRADVMVPTPAWVSYAPQARLLGHTVIALPTRFDQRWRVEPSSITQAVERKQDPSVPSVLILNYPGNPDGLTYSVDELMALAEVCRRHQVLVVSDEIYGLLHHQGQHRSLARYYPEGTVVTTGLSKWCGAGGWRLGVAMLPTAVSSDFKNALLGVASETYSCAATPVQMAACRAYEIDDGLHQYLTHQRRLLSSLGQWVAQTMTQAGVQVHAPQGGFYVFLDFTPFADMASSGVLQGHGIDSAQALCAKLLADTGVVLLPGDAFGMPAQHLCARLAYVEFDGAQALKASMQWGLDTPLPDVQAMSCFAKTVEGIQRLTAWLRAL